MTEKASGTFRIDSWDQETYDDAAGATLARARVTKTFAGDLVGTSTTDILTCVAQVETSAAYVGFERFTGTLAGRAGTFVLHHTAASDGTESGQSWSVVPDSGTGELRHLTGRGAISVDADGGHTFVLEYVLG